MYRFIQKNIKFYLFTMTTQLHKFLNPGTALIAVLLFLIGCYPKGPEYYSDLDLTATDYDREYNFGDQKVFWMADTVEYISSDEDDEIDPVDQANLLQEVESNLEARGYTLDRLNIDDAEFAITITVIKNENTAIGWVPYPPYNPGWGWGPGWGGYYPPYWGGYYGYSYTTGSVFIHWWDPQEPPVPSDEGDLQPFHWFAIFNGLASSSKDNNTSRIEASINQAFIQSPYIQSTK